MDHAVHNRIRPDDWVGLPAGVVGEKRRWTRRKSGWRWGVEGWASSPPPTITPPSLTRERCCCRELLVFVDHPSPTDQRTSGTSMPVQGNTMAPPSSRRHPPPPPPPVLLLPPAPPVHQMKTLSVTANQHLHLISAPQLLGQSLTARHQRCGETLRKRTPRISK